MTIRGRLLTLAVGGVVPLLVVGLTLLWAVWGGKQQQLNESLEQQAELAVVFDRWLDAQRQPLLTIASYPTERLHDPSALESDLRSVLVPRPHWVDLRVLDAGGGTVATHPANAASFPEGVAAAQQ